MFSDILELTRPQIPDGEPYSTKLEVGKNAALTRRCPCCKHGGLCSTEKLAVFDVSGLPCPDMSTAGKRLRRAGSTAGVYIAHGKYVTDQAVPLLLVECTKDVAQ